MKSIVFAVLGLAMIGSGGPAMAQAAGTNPLGECFVAKSTGQDRITFARWMVAAFASAPQVADVAATTPAKKQDLDRQMAALFTRLLTKDCAAEAGPLLGQKDSHAMEIAGGALGQIAVQELLSNPQAEAAMGDFVKYLNEADFAALKKK